MGAERRVALVEDDEQQQRIYCSALSRAGYEVRVWAGGGGAINEIRRWGAHAVVVDIRLPGIQGASVAMLAVRNLPGVYVLLHSAVDPEELLRTSTLAHCDAVSKDGEARGLLRKLNAHFTVMEVEQ